MCGIAGIARQAPGGIAPEALARMADALQHRGPDGRGVHVNGRVGLAHTRLGILDLSQGAQPMLSADGRFAISYNGEVFNYLELRAELIGCGHRFRTRTDTEVVLAGWREWGPALLPKLNGQFAFAVADLEAGTVALVRDRFGILPLFYALRRDALVFGSEMKALFASGLVAAEVDPIAVDEIFTFWSVRAPRTPFRDVAALRPGEWALYEEGKLAIHRWYTLDPSATMTPLEDEELLEPLLRSAVEGRLLADVAVGGYLSGGLDSSVVCALAAVASAMPLRTFSVAFSAARYDESPFQRDAAAVVGSEHTTLHAADRAIGEVFPEVVRHAETPLLRTAPAPLYLLSRLTREHGVKVVLSGEGADEIFWGYDLFKDTIARLQAFDPATADEGARQLGELYQQDHPRRGGAVWRDHFLKHDQVDDPLFSHLPRIRATEWIKGFYADGFAAELRAKHADPLGQLRDELPAKFGRWSPLERAAYLEIVTLLSPYLLASQGDRMAMAHGVEMRVPYLDHRIVELAARLPAEVKLRGLGDKQMLRRVADRILPGALARRPKHAYRAPATAAFFGPHAPAYVEELLAPAAIDRAGIFDPVAVGRLVERGRGERIAGMREEQALVGILSTQLWYRAFLDGGVQEPSAAPRGSTLERTAAMAGEAG